ncbi:MAG: nucleotide exchange factor GrpE [Xenococcaceae cyanobacterium]
MFDEPNLFWFGLVLWLGGTAFVLSLFGNQSKSGASSLTAQAKKIEELQQQCLRLREELQQQSSQLNADLRDATFEQLQTLLTNYPTAVRMAQAKPDLPAKNLVALFTPLENLLSSWGCELIGTPWEQVTYNPQLHQPDTDDIAEGELVYIRFVGYRDGERILYPAKVSRTLPGGIE